jgi:uncharacterized protein YlxW (UPF0749 family)
VARQYYEIVVERNQLRNQNATLKANNTTKDVRIAELTRSNANQREELLAQVKGLEKRVAELERDVRREKATAADVLQHHTQIMVAEAERIGEEAGEVARQVVLRKS